MGIRRSPLEIVIEYCITCNYRPIAASLAREIEAETGIKPAIIGSREPGAFEVKVNGNLVYSKKESGYFPIHSKLIEILKQKTGM